MVVQSVLFKKDNYSLAEALKKLVELGYNYIKLDETTNYYRFRQKEPDNSKKYVIKDSADVRGVKYVIEY